MKLDKRLRLMICIMWLVMGCGAPLGTSTPIPPPVTSLTRTVTPIPLTSIVVTPTATVIATRSISQGYEDLVRLFDYDKQAPLDIQEKATEDRDGIQVHDISYASPKGGRVEAYLVVPPGLGPFAGIVFLHRRGGSRRDFLNEATTLAKLGAVALSITAPFDLSYTERDRDQLIQIVIKLRRAVDLLTARPNVDANRIGYVGFGDGANFGGVLAGLEKRIKAYVLMSGIARFSKIAPLFITSKDLQAKFAEVMEPFDAIHFIGHAAPAALFFQAGRQDREFSEQDLSEYQQAGSEPKLIKWYDAGYGLNFEADRDNAEWLRIQLTLKEIP